MLDFLIIAIGIALTGYLAFSKRLGVSSYWKATVTPLASIMGSGFLVSAPLLAGIAGNLAVLCMAGLLLLAYGIGGAIRFNIRYFEPIENARGPAQHLAFLARVVLAGAYFISISYYLQLLAAFMLNGVGVENATAANGISSFLLVSIGVIGMWRGLGVLESVAKYVISLNLGMIGALLFGLLWFNVGLLQSGDWALAAISSDIDFQDLRVLLGLAIVVQGFETSRYIGDEHPAGQRIATMRLAQLISSAIYLLFIGLATVLFRSGIGGDVTAVIGMVTPVAVALPALLVITAIGSQFNAAVADNAGAGGLVEDISHRRLPIRYAYLLIMLVALVLTWETNVNQIIAYASRAFALFYALQCVVALIVAWSRTDLPGRHLRLLLFACLALVCLLVFLLGLPAE